MGEQVTEESWVEEEEMVEVDRVEELGELNFTLAFMPNKATASF